ncbi:head GIN domain-containing protein [Mucilaginibacter sp. AW1-3]
MKNQFTKFLAVILVVTASVQVAFSKAFADQTRPVSGFTAIASSGSFHVYVKIDGTESLKISADDAIIDKIETVVEGTTLKIRFKKESGWNDHGNKKADIYVSAKSLSSLVNSGSGTIQVENAINASNFKVVLSGSGSITTGAVKATKIDGVISGSGNINLNGGSAADASISISGSGSFDAKSLKTESTKVSISGSGNVMINAEKELSASLMGSGSVRYTGNASVHTSKMGSGSVSKESY